MANIKFTESQKKAIEFDGRNLLISAAAGSGGQQRALCAAQTAGRRQKADYARAVYTDFVLFSVSAAARCGAFGFWTDGGLQSAL